MDGMRDWQRKVLSQATIIFLTACATASAYAAAEATASSEAVEYSIREAQFPSDSGKPASKYRMLFTPTARWADAVHWKYNHANAPASLAGSKAAVIAQLRSSLDKWTAQCGITHVYDGETTSAPNIAVSDPANGQNGDGASVVGWGALGATYGAYTYDWWVQSGNQRVIFEADVMLSTTVVGSVADVDRVVTHEWGHALGLAHSNVQSAAMAGPPATFYSGLATLQPDDVRGCRCTYGLPPGVSAPYVCSLPDQVDFGTLTMGAASPPQSVTFTNSGNAPLTIQRASVTSTQFSHVSGCQAGTVVAPGSSCTAQLQATPANPGAGIGQFVLSTNDGDYELPLQVVGTAGWPTQIVPPTTVDVVEFYNATLDHYFITWNGPEIAKLDAGQTPTRWTRTGRTFKAQGTAQSGTTQVCRLYIPPSDGDSHFFGRNAAECSASQRAHPDFVLEDANYMQLYMPASGACPSGTQPLYRLFNGRRDANHRYTIERSVRDQMMAAGWIAEGDGSDLVAMCVPAQ